MPRVIYDCTFNKCGYSTTVEQVLHDALLTTQPHTENNTRLCTALVYVQKPPQWIMIPCNKTMGSAIQICETVQFDTNNLKVDSTTMENNQPYNQLEDIAHMYIGQGNALSLSLYVFEQTRGSISLFTDFTPVIRSSKCGVHCHVPQVRKTPFCLDGSIMSRGLCFQLFSKILKQSNMLKNVIEGCIFNGRLTKVNATYLANSSILDYLLKWTIAENQSIYVVDDIHEDINRYSCRNFKISESYSDFYTLDTNKLRESLGNQLTCAWKYIDELLCVHEPEISHSYCPEGTYKCRDHSCISESYRCDSQYDCPDGDDEYNCTYEWSFMNHPHCINQRIMTSEELSVHCDCVAVSLVCIYMFV